MIKIACCIPLSWSFVPKDFFNSVIGMMQYGADKYKLIFCQEESSFLDMNREVLVRKAKVNRSDYILFLDADQTYPFDTPERLLKHKKDIVGGVTPRRSGLGYLAFNLIKKGQMVQAPLNGLTKVDAMGMGGVMIRVEALERIKELPYFVKGWDKGIGDYIGEDVYFYNKCKEAGIEVFCDDNIKYGHIDTKPVII